jgi:hypothetical protein
VGRATPPRADSQGADRVRIVPRGTRTRPGGCATGRRNHGQRKLAKEAGVSLSELSAVLLGKRCLSSAPLAKLCVAVFRLQCTE